MLLMMESEREEEPIVYDPQDHPWLEMPFDDSVDLVTRYSLDEIRVG